jgi:hypothetical protein
MRLFKRFWLKTISSLILIIIGLLNFDKIPSQYLLFICYSLIIIIWILFNYIFYLTTEYDELVNKYDDLVDKNNRNVDYYNVLAESYIKLKDNKKALDSLNAINKSEVIENFFQINLKL